MTFRSVLLPGCGSLVALALVSHAWAQTSGSPAQGSAPAAARLGTVTVSAKRSVTLQDVSSGITVLSHEELESAGVRSVTDLGRVIPGFSADRRGNSAYTGLSLRGLAPLDYYTPSVVVYVDGVPQDASLMEQSLSNVERIEVLKGPQGTLYGKNAYAGVINIVTKKPGNTMSGYVKTTVAKLGQGGEAHITSPPFPVPIRDKRLSASIPHPCALSAPFWCWENLQIALQLSVATCHKQKKNPLIPCLRL